MDDPLDLPHQINDRYRAAFRNDLEHLVARLSPTLRPNKRRPAVQHATIPHRHPNHYEKPTNTP